MEAISILREITTSRPVRTRANLATPSQVDTRRMRRLQEGKPGRVRGRKRAKRRRRQKVLEGANKGPWGVAVAVAEGLRPALLIHTHRASL
ncbi:hypothetical protein OIDMADRAFT_181888 [Oidiodendron maius Zn]|uniref:Uncharacterized protein n=1 Tax=Oidiodendron maius (strain Zn) TaxID=913774 RepID=A0A0C3H5G1_OIDMZ|nr:hypothetical protein OIDMADRAFT_181888 [Oidiodendron maius Zn]